MGISSSDLVTVTLCSLCTFLLYGDRVGFAIAFSQQADEAGASQADKGWVLSAFYYGYICTQIPAARLVQVVGAHHLIFGAVLILAAISRAAALLCVEGAPVNLHLAFAMRVVVGAVQGFVFPSIHSVLAAKPSTRSAPVVSFATSGMYAGSAAAMLWLPGMEASRVYKLQAAAFGVWLVFWAADGLRRRSPDPSTEVFLQDKPKHDDDGMEDNWPKKTVPPVKAAAHEAIPWAQLCKSPPILAIVCANFAFHYVVFAFMNWTPSYFENAHHIQLKAMKATKIAPSVALFVFTNLSGVLSNMAVHVLPSKAHARKLLNTLGFLGVAVSLFALTCQTALSAEVAVGYLTLVAAFAALSRGGFAVNHMDVCPRYAGAVMGLANSAGTLAGIVGVAATGWLLEAFGPTRWGPVFVSWMAVSLFGAGAFHAFADGSAPPEFRGNSAEH
ncbi:major facilitator superfamily domain-containing protein [Pelagophyceae sp. CCMP2097]|nr:major facilitator superfamily domain-containing protein [Pelagophyceae sp. CCMP2097]